MKPRAAPRLSNGYHVSLSAVLEIMSKHLCTHTHIHAHTMLIQQTLAYIYCLVWSWSPNGILISNDLLNVFLISSLEQHNDFSLFYFGPKALMVFAWVGLAGLLQALGIKWSHSWVLLKMSSMFPGGNKYLFWWIVQYSASLPAEVAFKMTLMRLSG